jgi:heme oxygenase
VDLHQQLKQATAASHSRLEADSMLAAYLSPALDRPHYLAIVAHNLAACSHWQRQADAALQKLNLDPRWRIDTGAEQLQQELALTDGIAPTIHQPGALPLHDEASYLGCAYVFEGSKLGASLILKKLRRNPNLASVPFYYFEHLAGSTSPGPHWQQWMADLQQLVSARELEQRQLCAAANQCFEVIGEWFRMNTDAISSVS